MLKVGFIDYFLDEFHANHYPKWIKERSNGELIVKYAYAKMNSPKGGLTTEEWCQKHKIEQIQSIQELVQKSDVIVVLSPDNPEMHEELCELPLSSGKRTYVDKTFARNKEEAKKILAIAEKFNTPCFSSSALRFAEEYQNLNKAEIVNITSVGPGPLDTYSIHQIEPLVAIFGSEVQRLQFVGTAEHPSLVIEWSEHRRAVIHHHGWEIPFTMYLDYKDQKSEKIEIKSDYFLSFIDEMVDFFLRGTEKVPHQETVAVVSVCKQAMRSLDFPGKWITI